MPAGHVFLFWMKIKFLSLLDKVWKEDWQLSSSFITSIPVPKHYGLKARGGPGGKALWIPNLSIRCRWLSEHSTTLYSTGTDTVTQMTVVTSLIIPTSWEIYSFKRDCTANSLYKIPWCDMAKVSTPGQIQLLQVLALFR